MQVKRSEGETKLKTISAICLDCSKARKEGKELKLMTTTAQLALHARFNPTHRVEIIQAGDYDRKTGFVLKPK